MSSDFFYLLSSLPSLSLGEKPGLDYEAFLVLCADRLSESETAILTGLSLDPESCCDGLRRPLLLSQWLDWERDMRNTIADFRAKRIKQQGTRWLRETSDVYVDDRKRLEDILNSAKAREREDAIDAFFWQKLDELSRSHTYDFEVLIIYALQLKLAEKQQKMLPETGASVFGELAGKLEEQAAKLRQEI